MNVTITLTDEQEQAIVAKHVAPLTKQLTKNAEAYARSAAAAKRRADKRVERAKQKATMWRLRYGEMRKRLLETQAKLREPK